MSNTLGDIRGQIILDVKQALNAYTAVRQEHVSTVTALATGGGAIAASGAMIAGAGIAMGAGLMTAVNAAAEFERKLDYFSAVSGATQDEYEAIRQKALQLGADTIYSADQIADSFVELSKSGVSTQEVLAGIGEAVANLGAAADMPLTEAATGLTTVLNTFGLQAEDAVGVVDKLAGAANASAIDVQDLILTLTYAGASAKVAGIEFGDVNAAIALLGERGIRGSKAGTGLRQMFDKLLAPTNKGKTALEGLGIILEDGTNKLLDYDGGLKPIPALLDTLNGALAPLSTAEKMDVLGNIFPITSLPTILNLLDGGSEAIARMNGEIGKTTAMDIASERLDNLSGDIEILRGNIDTLMITAGSSFQNFARGIVQGVTAMLQWFMDLNPVIQQIILIMTAVSAVALTLTGGMGMLAGAILNIISLAIRMGPALAAVGAVLKSLTPIVKLFMLAFLPAPLRIIIPILAALAAGLAYFFTQTETGQAAFAQIMGLFNTFATTILPQVIPFIVQLATTIGSFLSGALSAILPLLTQLATTIGGWLMTALQVVAPLLQVLAGLFAGALASGGQILVGLLTIVANVLSAVIAPILPIINQLLAGTAAAFAGVGQNASGIEGIGAIVGSVLAAVINMIPVILTALIQLVTLIIQTVVGMAPALLTAALTAFTGLVTAITGILPTIISVVISMITGILTAIVTALPAIITAGLQLFTGLVQAVVTILPMIIEAVTQLIIQLVTALVGMIPQLLQAGIQLLQGLIQAVVTVLPMLITAVLQGIVGIIGALISLIPQILAAAIQLFMGIVQAIPQIIPPLLQAVIQLITILPTTLLSMLPVLLEAAVQLFLGIVTAIATALPLIIEGVVGILPALIEAVISMIPALLEAAVQLFTALVQAIPTIIGALIEAVITLITTLVPTLIGLIPVLLQAAIQLFMALVQAIPQIIGALVSAIGGLIGPIVDNVIRMAPQLLNAAINFFKSIGEAIPRVIPQIVSQLVSMGTQMIQGLVNGVKNMANGVINAVKDVVGGAVNFAKGLLGIKSPSRVFMGIGVNTILGLVKGIHSERRNLNREMSVIANDMSNFYDQVGAAAELDASLRLSTGTTQFESASLSSQLAALSLQLQEIAEKDTINIEKLEVTKEEGEELDVSLPNAIRKTAYLVGK